MKNEGKTKGQSIRLKDLQLHDGQITSSDRLPLPSPELKHHLSELIDMALLKQLFESFHDVTGILHAVLDPDNNILSTSGWTEICTRFHRTHPETEHNCRLSDSYIKDHLDDGQPFIGYKCLNGMMDYAIPIIIEGQHLGSLFSGQVFHEPPDEDFFRQQARKYGFDEEAYLEAVRKVKIVPEKEFRDGMMFFSKLAEIFSTLGVERMKKLARVEEKFSKAFQVFPDPVTISDLASGVFEDVNDAWVETVGFEKDEAIGRSSLELGLYLSPEQRTDVLEKLSVHGYIRDYENSFCMGSGEIRTFLTSAVVLGADPKPRLLTIQKDITERKSMEKRLKISEEKFSKAFRSNPDWITISSIDEGRYIEVNDTFLETTGFQRSEAIGHTVKELGTWAFLEERDILIKQIMDHGIVRNFETVLRTKTGENRNFLISGEIIDMRGIPHLIVACKDITQQRLIEERLRQSEAELRTVFENANGIIYTMSLEGTFIYVSPGWGETLGQDPESVKGKHFDYFVHPEDVAGCRQFMEKILVTGQPQKGIEYRIKHIDGSWRWHTSNGALVNNGGEEYFVGLAVDITERKKAEEEILYLSFHDKLTGLYNRAYFEKQLQEITLSRLMPLSVIMGDVNGLKLINDALGHLEGDRLLIDVAETLTRFCRKEDIIARWGGDEFIVLMPACGPFTAAQVTDRIRTACEQKSNWPIKSSLSLGTAIMYAPDQDVRQVIREAEDKMYRNKLMNDRSNRSSFLMSLQQTLWSRSNETEAHCRRLQEMAQRIGHSLGLSASELDDLRLLSLLHDIGKIAIPDSILDKPGKLTIEEWDTIAKHPEIGYRIAISSPEIAPIAPTILHHHERWDGMGYPLGLKGEEIPLASRIIAILDTYDVMVNGRPYQKAVSPEAALFEISRCAGSQFDPHLAEKSIKVLSNNYLL